MSYRHPDKHDPQGPSVILAMLALLALIVALIAVSGCCNSAVTGNSVSITVNILPLTP